MKTSDILINALNTIDVPEQWCKGTGALNSELMPVAPESEHAVSWCSLGAISKTQQLLGATHMEVVAAKGVLWTQTQKIGEGEGVAHINDKSENVFSSNMTQMWCGSLFEALVLEDEAGS